MARIAVVGAGISGLAVGLELLRAGTDVIVLEATGRPGGVIASRRVDGRVLELGPQRTRLTPPVRDLVRELGLEDTLITAPDLPLYILADGRLRLAPLSARDALRTDLLTWTDRLRILAEPLTPGLRDDETAARFFTRKLGRRAYRRVAGPLYGGLYGSDPADMPARHGLAPMLDALGVRRSLLAALFRAGRSRDRAPACSFRDGLQTLTDAMARALGDRLRLDSPVDCIEGREGGFGLQVGAERVAADRVVLAAPAAATARVLEPIDPDAGRRLRSLRYNPLALVHLHSDADLHGLGYQVALDEDMATRGVTWNHSLFGRTGLYTAFLGGATHPGVAGAGDAELGAVAAAEFEAVTGAEPRVLGVHRTAMPAWDRSWDQLGGLSLPAGLRVCASWAARPGIHGRLMEARRLARELSAPAGSPPARGGG